MKKIYIISGLGADERVFYNFRFENYNVVYINWLIPEIKESLTNYTLRMRNQINDDEPIIIGLSFGGMMAIEISKITKVKKLILISSAKTKFELPFYFRLIGKLKLHKILPYKILKIPNFITNWIFGVNTKYEKQLLNQILKDTHLNYLKWSINTIVNWQNTFVPENILHIHGSKDRLLPIKQVKNKVEIKTGGHLMVLNHNNKIEKIILDFLNKN